MTEQQRKQSRHAAAVGQTWSWPVTLSRYDRSPTLTAEEAEALASLARKDRRPRLDNYPNLVRLTRPLADALEFAAVDKDKSQATLKFLVDEMHRRCTPFWAWSDVEWVDILRPGWKDFGRHYAGSVNQNVRINLIAIAYLLCGFTRLRELGRIELYNLACKVFGQDAVDEAQRRVKETIANWGYTKTRVLRVAVCNALLANRSPRLEDLTVESLVMARRDMASYSAGQSILRLSRVLAAFRIIEKPLDRAFTGTLVREKAAEAEAVSEAAPEWIECCRRWRDTSTYAPITRQFMYYQMLHMGLWAAREHPEAKSPEQWTREIALAYVAHVDRMVIGEWRRTTKVAIGRLGKPLSPRSKVSYLGAARMFFRDCQEWGWIPRRFDPARTFAAPPSITRRIGPNPRVIEDSFWLKLLGAGLQLTSEDLSYTGNFRGTQAQIRAWYPIEMVRATLMVWFFAGLRRDEIRRLRVGCIRWDKRQEPSQETDASAKRRTCWLDVPVNKTQSAFTKPVDPLVGEAIEAWEHVRPKQPQSVDMKTGEVVDFLFSFRGVLIGKTYLNDTLIPLLCRKAGIPEHDARGKITSHRARATIATQLFNAKEPMTLFELQQWLGHSTPLSTQYYAQITPTKLAKSYRDAGYFERNLRMINVLVDQEAIKSGAAAAGEPWRYYDLGHGYCTYDFFDQCPHRMACAKCSFYRPKGSSQAHLIEARANLLRMRQEIPLTDEERAAVDDGIAAMETMCDKLADVPTPDGQTPRQLSGGRRSLPMLPITQVTER